MSYSTFQERNEQGNTNVIKIDDVTKEQNEKPTSVRRLSKDIIQTVNYSSHIEAGMEIFSEHWIRERNLEIVIESIRVSRMFLERIELPIKTTCNNDNFTYTRNKDAWEMTHSNTHINQSVSKKLTNYDVLIGIIETLEKGGTISVGEDTRGTQDSKCTVEKGLCNEE